MTSRRERPDPHRRPRRSAARRGPTRRDRLRVHARHPARRRSDAGRGAAPRRLRRFRRARLPRRVSTRRSRRSRPTPDLGPLGRLVDPPAHDPAADLAACSSRTSCAAGPRSSPSSSPAPIIVIGLPRSGTTHLVNLIAADRRLRSLPYWESLEPCPLPGDGTAPRRRRPALHALSKPTTTRRCRWCRCCPRCTTSTRPPSRRRSSSKTSTSPPTRSSCYARVPAWRDFYFTLDQHAHYAYLKKVLQVLTFLRGPNRWVLKSPQHLEQIPALLATFPDATFAITHRDPVSVIQSAITMLAYGDRMRRTAIEPEALAEYWVDRVDRLAARLRARPRPAARRPQRRRAVPRVHGRRRRHGRTHLRRATARR